MITHDSMMHYTRNMPMKQIDTNGEPYLQRYYAGTFADGADLWLHRILRNDAERHIHSHPFEFSSIMLTGAYTEEFLNEINENDFRYSFAEYLPDIVTPDYLFGGAYKRRSKTFVFSRPDARHFDVFDWHRIAAAEPNTWTACVVQPRRLPFWYFKNDLGIEAVKSSPKEWWHDYKTRPEKGYANDDNKKTTV